MLALELFVLGIGILRSALLAFALAGWIAAGAPSGALAQAQHVSVSSEAAKESPYGAVFDRWLTQSRAKLAILVVRRDGKTVFARGHNADPRAPALIASLSKPITGACIATLVRDGKLSFTTPMREALPEFFKLFGRPIDERLEEATVEELLVHRAGLRGNADDDPIFDVLHRRADGGAGPLAEARAVLAEYLLQERLARHPGGRYSYSNTGYAMLSAIIEEHTKRSYEDYCGEAVFGKLGLAKPRLHPDWRMLSGAGGWFVPGPDYLAFLDIFDPAHPFLSDEAKAWIDRAQTRWTPTNRRRWYSLGVNTWARNGRWTVSHGGLMNARGKSARGADTIGQIVSHAFRAANGTGVFMVREWSEDARESLDNLRQAVGEAHRLVKTRP